MIKELVENNKTELPALFDANFNVPMNRARLEVMLQLVKTAQTTSDINEQIASLQRLQKIIERFLK